MTCHKHHLAQAAVRLRMCISPDVNRINRYSHPHEEKQSEYSLSPVPTTTALHPAVMAPTWLTQSERARHCSSLGDLTLLTGTQQFLTTLQFSSPV
ncbi:hypothetical protein SRHO_G00052200 [Serrasalmus rhombeus]